MIRAFLAIELDDARRSRLAALQGELRQVVEGRGERQARVTWAAPPTLHLTIKFLGEIEEAFAGRLKGAIAPALSATHPVALPLDRLGAFPTSRAPRTLWIGPSDDQYSREAVARVVALHATIDAACAGAGLARDPHPLRPHLTLARVRSGERQVGRALTDAGLFDRSVGVGSVACGTVVLMKSDLNPTGPIHTPLWSLPLG